MAKYRVKHPGLYMAGPKGKLQRVPVDTELELSAEKAQIMINKGFIHGQKTVNKASKTMTPNKKPK